MMRTQTYIALALAAFLALPGGEATAASWRHERSMIGRPIERTDMRSDQNDAREGVRTGRIQPLGKVLRRVHERYPGQLLDAQLVDAGGRPVYLIKLMTPDGNVGIVSADAATGDIIDYRQGGR
ncbi:hypothetical protein F2P47_04050 [Parvibaculum sedimenti]|uniref:PepSY domain-containing protein n=1 Tax=Parvibaculum sedimenti TaxID=2608632 RepID=A0A6N6VPY1_9HYPH|nr:PepSY domain-containing protein [Parvibaculum sedimenti]KAB7741584.1 hypothetical protein F2P47_04050 [Parvibaculum sedimenti]